MIGRVVVAALVAVVPPAWAAEVTSARIDRTTATLYQSYRGFPDIALIAETRTVELPAGDNVIHFEGVASTLIPQTARVEGVPNPPRNLDFDYALFDAATILDKSIGGPAELIQSPAKGEEIRRVGQLISQQGVLAFQDENGVETFGCGGPPARLVVGMPSGLRSKPALSVRVRTDRPGRHVVRLSYLAQDISWRAVYVARISRDGRRMDLEGRIVLNNGSATGFHNVPTRYVAGNVRRLAETRAPQIVAAPPRQDCWTFGRTSDPVFDRRFPEGVRGMFLKKDAEEQITSARAYAAAPAPAGRSVTVENLGDLKLFRLEEPVRIAPLQQKLFTFMTAHAVTVKPAFIVPFVGRQSVVDVPIYQTWRVSNTKAAGLGKPLPHGAVTLYQGRGVFLGSDTIPQDVATGGQLTLKGRETDRVMFDHQVVAANKDGADSVWTHSFVFRNNADHPVDVELRLPQTDVRAVKNGPPNMVIRDGAFVWTLRLSAYQQRKVLLTTVEPN